MIIENRTVDLRMDANLDFGYLLQFTEVDVDDFGKETILPIDLTGFSFKGSISDKLNDGKELANFDIGIADAKKGIVTLFLDKGIVNSLPRRKDSKAEEYNSRLKFVGYYDVISTNTLGSQMRILEGKIFISEGVTK
ncbi:l-shaped tail fiber protein p132 [Proteus phage VTCCBPA139]|nr:l-shaped tail fiber protein p132 [Proteus phage VTCCBPA139]